MVRAVSQLRGNVAIVVADDAGARRLPVAATPPRDTLSPQFRQDLNISRPPHDQARNGWCGGYGPPPLLDVGADPALWSLAASVLGPTTKK